MVSIDETPLAPDDVKVKQRSGLYPVNVPYIADFQQFALLRKDRSFLGVCDFKGF